MLIHAGPALPAKHSAVILRQNDTLQTVEVVRSRLKNVYVAHFGFPDRPPWARPDPLQMSAALRREEQYHAIDAFIDGGRPMEFMK